MRQALTPAEAVIAAFGGVHKTARVLDEQLELGDYEGCRRPVHASTVSRWQPSDRRGSGAIPPRWHEPILDASERLGTHITTDVLVRGLRAPGEPA